MPEMPEVETVVLDLNRSSLLNLTILDITVFWDNTISKLTVKEFKDLIINQKINKIARLGKHILFYLSNHLLGVHLRMTGQFAILNSLDDLKKHDRLVFTLSDQRFLVFRDMRKFGRFRLLNSLADLNVGIEGWDSKLDFRTLLNLYAKSNKNLKALLLDQSLISGLGNIYADEALFLSKLLPTRTGKSLSESDAKNLVIAIKAVLNKGLKNMGTTLGTNKSNFYSVSGKRGNNQDSLLVFRRTGEPCFNCQNKIQRIKLAQRSTHFCATCQK